MLAGSANFVLRAVDRDLVASGPAEGELYVEGGPAADELLFGGAPCHGVAAQGLEGLVSGGTEVGWERCFDDRELVAEMFAAEAERPDAVGESLVGANTG